VLGLSLILQEIPETFRHDYFHGYIGPQPYSLDNQSPRLLNRQIKAAVFHVYKSLLEKVLTSFKLQVLLPDSWTRCLFLSVCLAFLLENIEVGNLEFVYFARNVYKEELGSMSGIREYNLEVDSVVFARMYRLLVLIKGKGPVDSLADIELAENLRQTRHRFGKSRLVHYCAISNIFDQSFRGLSETPTWTSSPFITTGVCTC
jgi:hypothetical protein